MNTQKALQILNRHGIENEFNSLSYIVPKGRPLLKPSVLSTILTEILGFDSYSEEFITKDVYNVLREREVYNSYLMSYLFLYCMQDRMYTSEHQFKLTYDRAADRAIYLTTQRLYGNLKWVDGFYEEQKSFTIIDSEIVMKKVIKTEGKLKGIYTHVLELIDQGKDRVTIIDIISRQYNIMNRPSAVTYYNNALRLLKPNIVTTGEEINAVA